ncbi:hypothetical protein ACX1N5_03980 [Acinetobacter sp. ANC 4636]
MNMPVHQNQNPFAVSAPQTQAMSTVQADSQRAVAEVQAALVIAKQFPRNMNEAWDRIMNACQRPTLAQSSVYSYAKSGTSITGPSIRLAEALAQNWGNIQFGIRELSAENGESTVEAFAWDVETNTRQTKVFQVRHWRHTKQGGYALTDPRDIYELVASNGARRLRACILGVIPGDVIDAAVAQCEQTIRASADTSPEGVQKLLKSFEKQGITKEAIEKRIQCRIGAISPAQVISLIKIGTSIKDGMSAAQDWFEIAPEKSIQEAPKLTLNDDEFNSVLEQLNAGAIDKAYILDGYGLTDAQRVAVEAQ